MARSRTSRMDVVYRFSLHEDFKLSRRLVSPRSHVKKRRKKKRLAFLIFPGIEGRKKTIGHSR